MVSIAHIQSCIDRVRDSGTASDLEVVWKSHEGWPGPLPRLQGMKTSSSDLHISVLDSSFNPPTLAHLALALSPPPPPLSLHPINTGIQLPQVYDAHLLLLSVTNADKSLKVGDPSFPERVEMIIALAEEMKTQGTHHVSSGNVAVAVIDEATFVGKSAKLLRYLRDHRMPHLGDRTHRLTFVLGTDTITRFFSSHYYQSEEVMKASIRKFFLAPQEAQLGEEGDGSQIACARRGSNLSNEGETKFLQSPGVIPYVEMGGVRMMDIPPEAAMSSTLVREGIRDPQRSGIDWEKMCAPQVAQYIKVHGLYLE